jgi:hypothetical protein
MNFVGSLEIDRHPGAAIVPRASNPMFQTPATRRRARRSTIVCIGAELEARQKLARGSRVCLENKRAAYSLGNRISSPDRLSFSKSKNFNLFHR